MKPERNQPCPCGSGKKYKKCCYLKEEDSAAEPTAQFKLPEKWEEDEERRLALHETMIDVMNKMRRITLDKKPHIKEYDKARKLHGEIVDSMVRYLEDGNFQLKANIDHILSHNQGGKRDIQNINLLQNHFDLGTRIGAESLYDLLIYKIAPHLSCITEDFLQSRRYRRADKLAFLHSMLDSKLGLFEIIKVDSKEGYAYLKEVFNGAEYKITDIGLSGSGEACNDIYLYTRIIQYNGVSFGTGLNLIFKKDDSFIKNHIREQKKNYKQEAEAHRFMQLYAHYSQHPEFE